MTSFDLATVGDNCIDRFLPLRKSAVGGNAVNVAVQLAQLGRAVAYFGAVGPDWNGQRTADLLSARGVLLNHMRVLDGRTAYTDLDRDRAGDRIIAYEDFGVCADYHPTAAEIAILRRMRYVHLGWMKDSPRLKRELAESGVLISQDTAVNPGAAGLDLAFGSAGPDLEEAQRMLDRLLAEGARCAVVTCGPLGSIASDGTMTARTGIAPVDVVDTTGAGDTFIAGFVDAWLNGVDLQRCIERGRDLAAVTCGHLGGFRQILEPLDN